MAYNLELGDWNMDKCLHYTIVGDGTTDTNANTSC